MPNGGQLSAGSGIQLQQTYPGSPNIGNANISGKFRANAGGSFLFGPGANNQQIGDTFANTQGGNMSTTVCYGSNITVVGASTDGVVIGNGAVLGENVQLAKGCIAIGGFAHAGGRYFLARDKVIGFNSFAAGSLNGMWPQSISCFVLGDLNQVTDCRGVALFNIDGCTLNGRQFLTAINDNTNALQNDVYFAGRDNCIVIGSGSEDRVKIGKFLITDPTMTQFKQTASATVANTIAETTLTAAGAGSLTIPANVLRQGSTIRIRARGVVADTGAPTLRLRAKIQGTTFIDTGAVALPGLVGTHGWVFEGDITIRTQGAGGTALGNGALTVYAPSTVDAESTNTATSAVDTTLARVLDLTAEWGTANVANTITCTNLTMEILQ